ncbi:MAG: PAS domain-containing protein [Gammaproteobacteria bacterium]
MDPVLASTMFQDWNHLPWAFVMVDCERRIVAANAAFCTLIDASQDSLTGVSLGELFRSPVETVSSGIQRVRVTTNGRVHWLQLHRHLFDGNDGTEYAAWLVSDITDLDNRRRDRASASAGRSSVEVDSDTGALRREAIIRELGAQVSRSRRYANPLSCLLVHMQAPPHLLDETRRATAKAISDHLRWVDRIGVLSPLEFLVVLPETSEQGVAAVRDKVESFARTGTLPECAQIDVQATVWTANDSTDGLLSKLRRRPPIAGADAA